MAAVPTPLAPPWMSTDSPARSSASWNRFTYAVRNASGTAAASGSDRRSGTRIKLPAGTGQRSA